MRSYNITIAMGAGKAGCALQVKFVAKRNTACKNTLAKTWQN